MKMKRRTRILAPLLLLACAAAPVSAESRDPTFLVEKQLGQATGRTCQSYVLAIALAFKRDSAVPVRSWHDVRETETRLRAEAVKAHDARAPNAANNRRISAADSAKAVEAVTQGRYTVRYRRLDIGALGDLVATRTGLASAASLQPSFFLGATVKDVVISSAKKIGATPYDEGHQFVILGVSGPPNSTREYLVLNSAAYKRQGEQAFNSCQDSLPDDPSPFIASLSWRNDIEWNLDENGYRALTVEKK